MHATPRIPVRNTPTSSTAAPCRLSPVTAKTSVKTDRPTLYRTTLSRSSVVAMIRGVSCPPATWIATSSEPNVNTRNDSVSVMTVWYNDCAPAGSNPTRRQRSQLSSPRSMGARSSTRTIAMIGTVHSADLR